jgi:tetratricopeptide (TPR) repeat protein
LGRIEEARSDFLKAQTDHPYHIHVLNNLGTCYAKLLNFEKAVEYYNRALALSPRFEQAILNLGAVYFQMAKYSQARELLLGLIRHKPHSKARLYLNMVENKIDSIEKRDG